MSKLCEMRVFDYFKFINMETVFVGMISPELDEFLCNIDAEIYIDGERYQSIKILGEDRFVGGYPSKRDKKRSVRTAEKIKDIPNGSEIKIVFYK